MIRLKEGLIVAKKDSVYDFLYIDWDRISGFISQLNDMGVITEINQTHSQQVNNTDRISGRAGFSLGAGSTKAGLKGAFDTTKERTSGREIEKNFNARFALPITFLDLLNHRDLISRKPEKWSVGNIALFTGQVTIVEMATLATVMSEFITNHPEDTEAMKMGFEVIKAMPPTAQAIMLKGIHKVWSVYKIENWETHPTSLTLSNGAQLEGQWSIIGIVDAKPNKKPNKGNGSLFSEIMAASVEFSYSLRETMGRPDNCFAFTPLLLFREVK